MCGITGFAGNEDKNLLQGMLSLITYRGPDDSGVFVGDNVSIGARRLAIIDLATGSQPIHNENEDIWIVYNGELYNYRLLKKELEEKGHRFYTASDTEVFVHAYEEYGEGFVKKLRGMYTFAIWDSNEKKLLLARDEAGIKPLYYYFDGRVLVFGSEIKCILHYPGIERKIDTESLDCFFSFGCVLGDGTLFKGIRKLLPGHLLVHKDNAIRIEKFWNLCLKPFEQTQKQLTTRIRSVLDECVHLQMMSDVPLGAYLSGGIDSSAVVGTMTKFIEKPIETFTVGFDEADDECSYARQVSEAFSTNHHELFLDDAELPKAMPSLVYHFDDLIGDAAMVPTYFLSKFAKRYVTVVLTGEGGDEIFAGYNRYKPMSDLFFFVPKNLRTKFFGDVITIFDKKQKKSFYSGKLSEITTTLDPYGKHLKRYFNNRENVLNQTLLFGFEQILPNQLLAKVDRATMASSIEARVPLLDKELIGLSATIRPDLKMRFLNGKYIFKKALYGLVPNSILERKKHGFDVPLTKWFRGELGEYAKQVFSEGDREREYLDRYKIASILNGAMDFKDKKTANRVWHLLLLELWAREFIDSA